MRRNTEEPISSRIQFPAITGEISAEAPAEVVIGDDIKVTISFQALNPGALYWKTFVIADSPALNKRWELDATREIGQEAGRTRTYNLGPMPDKDVTISIFLFAHDDASYDWDWEEYSFWTRGYPTEVEHLDSAYLFISPEEKVPEASITGLIRRVAPSRISFGNPIDIAVDFNAYCDSLYYQVRGWQTRVKATLNGFGDSDVQEHYGRDGSRTDQMLHLGTMPAHDLAGEVILEGRPLKIPRAPWGKLGSVEVIVEATDIPEEPEEPEEPGVPPERPEEGEFPWIPAALIAGGLGFIIAGSREKKK